MLLNVNVTTYCEFILPITNFMSPFNRFKFLKIVIFIKKPVSNALLSEFSERLAKLN